MNFACWLADYDLYDKHSYSILTLFLTCTCSPAHSFYIGKAKKEDRGYKIFQDHTVGQENSVFATILNGLVWFGWCATCPA